MVALDFDKLGGLVPAIVRMEILAEGQYNEPDGAGFPYHHVAHSFRDGKDFFEFRQVKGKQS